jgi:precorrin-6B methylase 2
VNAFKAAGFLYELTLVNIARGTAIQKLTRLAALNPVFIISARMDEVGAG